MSSISGRGMKTAWDTSITYGDFTEAFCALGTTPDTVDNWMEPLERSVVLPEPTNSLLLHMARQNKCIVLLYCIVLYNRISSQETAYEARKELFTKKGE